MRRFFARIAAALDAFRTGPTTPAAEQTEPGNAISGDVADSTVVQARDIDSLNIDRRVEIGSATYVNHGIANVNGAGPIVTGNTGPVTIGAGTQITGSTVHTGNGTQINY